MASKVKRPERAMGLIGISRFLRLDAMQGDKGVSFGQPGKASLFKRQLTTSGEKRSKLYE